MTENKENEILLNIMYNGDYLMSDNKNIGHEVINLFQSDNGNNYIYVLPYGCMAKEHNDKIETIVLVKRHNASLLEILAKAEELEQIIHLDDTRPNCQERIHKEQIKHIKNNDIKYGGIYLHEIMNDNDGSDIAFYVTFKAKRIVKPKKRIFLTVDNKEDTKHSKNCKNIHILKDVENFAKQSPKMYINSVSDKKAYNTLNKIINNADFWKRKKDSRKVNMDIKTSKENAFIDIIKKGYDELSYSNLFQYIFNADRKLFYNFTKDVLKVTMNGNYVVERETGNIDLLIYNYKKVIVIENKIKSGINGICFDEDGKIIGSQLGKYQTYVDDKFSDDKYKKSYFVFTPDYNIIDLKVYDKNKNYKLIKYSTIYEFFHKNRANCRDIPYYKEFLYALEKHVKEIDNNNDIDAERRFVKAIKEKQK